jgi:RNA polymerase sigma-70 factor, ECF subfamily
MDDSLPSKVDRFMTELMRHQRRLYQHIHALLPRQHDAEDAMQDVLVVLWKKFDQFDAGTSFYAWASRVAYLEVQNYRRRNSRLVTILDEEVFEQIAVEVERQADFLEVRRDAMQRCAQRLSATDRELLNLRYVPGASVKEIALRLGRPANSVCKSLGRIRQALWECINEEMAARGQGGDEGSASPPEEARP